MWQALNHYAYLDAVFLAERLYAEGNVCLSVCLPAVLPFCLSTCWPVCLSTCLSASEVRGGPLPVGNMLLPIGETLQGVPVAEGTQLLHPAGSIPFGKMLRGTEQVRTHTHTHKHTHTVTQTHKLLSDMYWTLEVLCSFPGGHVFVDANVWVRAFRFSLDFLSLTPWYKHCRSRCVNTAGDPGFTTWEWAGVDDKHVTNMWQMQKRNAYMRMRKWWHTRGRQRKTYEGVKWVCGDKSQ